MGNAAAKRALRTSMQQSSYQHVLRVIRDAPADAQAYRRRAYNLLLKISDACVDAIVPQGETNVTREHLRQIVELVHEWMETIGSDCPQCRLPQLARRVLEHSSPTWERDEIARFAREYTLNVCGFVDTDDDTWHIDNTALARIIERVNKAELITRRSISSMVRPEPEGEPTPPVGSGEVRPGTSPGPRRGTITYVPSSAVATALHPGETVPVSDIGVADMHSILKTEIAPTDERLGADAFQEGGDEELSDLDDLEFV